MIGHLLHTSHRAGLDGIRERRRHRDEHGMFSRGVYRQSSLDERLAAHERAKRVCSEVEAAMHGGYLEIFCSLKTLKNTRIVYKMHKPKRI